MGSTERFTSSVNTERAWVVAAVLSIAVVVGGVLAFPRLVYDRFIWQYFWGPVYADANNAACAVMDGGTVRLLGQDACKQAAAAGNIVAKPGYTLVSEAGYAIMLLFMLAGVLLLVRRLDIGDRRLFFALVPFMLFGGALRVVEDATDAALEAGAGTIIGYPFNTLIISPVIYFVVFLVTLASLLVAVGLHRQGIIDRYASLLAGIGTALFVLTTAYIGYLVLTGVSSAGNVAGFYPQITVLVVFFSVVISVGVYRGIDRIAPWIHDGTGRMGLVVLFGQTLDGVANVLVSDWMGAIGLPFLTYSAKHPINRIIIDITGTVLPQSVINTIGSSWPFLLVKVIAAVAVIALFDEKIFEENRRYALLLLVAIVAVGLGPGTRDMIRATFGI